MFQKVSEASAHESGPEGSRKPRTYASSRVFWMLLETVQSSCGRSCWSVLELGLVLLKKARSFWTVLESWAVQQGWLAL